MGQAAPLGFEYFISPYLSAACVTQACRLDSSPDQFKSHEGKHEPSDIYTPFPGSLL